MAAGHISKSSTFPSNSQQLNNPVDGKKLKSTCLYIQKGELFLKRDYDGLKELIDSDFNLSGEWLSSGGESKEFIHRDFVLKCQGKSKHRLTVVKDNQQSYLLNALKGYASEMDDENTVNTFSDSEANDGKFVKHVVVEIIDQDENNASCFNNDRYLQDLNKIMSTISQLREAHEKERLNAIIQATKYEATNKALTEGQIKMTAEIQDLKSTVEKLENENKSIRKVLGIKQDGWQNVETRKCSNSKKNEQKFEISVQNSFSGLEIEDSKLTSFPEIIEIEKKTEKRSRKNEKCPNGNHLNTRECLGNATTKHQDPAKPNEKITLVIGDSMVKTLIVRRSKELMDTSQSVTRIAEPK